MISAVMLAFALASVSLVTATSFVPLAVTNGTVPRTSQLALDGARGAVHATAVNPSALYPLLYRLSDFNGGSAQAAQRPIRSPFTSVIGGVAFYDGAAPRGLFVAGLDAVGFVDLSRSAPARVQVVAGTPGGNGGTSDGMGSLAQFMQLWNIAVAGEAVFITDMANNCFRRGDVVWAAGAPVSAMQLNVTTAAGTCGGPGGNRDGLALGGQAQFDNPTTLAVTGSGRTMYTASNIMYGNGGIRKIGSLLLSAAETRTVSRVLLSTPQASLVTAMVMHPQMNSDSYFLLIVAGGNSTSGATLFTASGSTAGGALTASALGSLPASQQVDGVAVIPGGNPGPSSLGQLLVSASDATYLRTAPLWYTYALPSL
jgi:hypothetical protein